MHKEKANKNFSHENGQALMRKLRRLKENELKLHQEKRRNSLTSENDLAVDFERQREELKNFESEKQRLKLIENLNIYKTSPTLELPSE